jgi:hypothetical protein
MNFIRQCALCFHASAPISKEADFVACHRVSSQVKQVLPFDSCIFFSALHDTKQSEKRLA